MTRKSMRIDVRCPNGDSVKWSADAEVLAKPGVEAMWATITSETIEFVTRRYHELMAERRAAVPPAEAPDAR